LAPKVYTLDEAKTRSALAEAKAYEAEARYHNLQADRLERSFEDEVVALDAQRIYDFTGEVSTNTVRHAINELTEWRARDPESPITVRFFTPGGDVLAGLALYDYLRELQRDGIKVTTVAIGMAASMGAILLQAGSTRLVTPNSYIMVHEVSTIALGKLSELKDEQKFTQRIQDRLLEILAERSTLTTRQIRTKWTRKDWWLDAKDAVDVGFADGIAVTPS